MPKAGDWGLFCAGDGVAGVTPPDANCYAKGERGQGAAGHPAVQWKPCCDGQAQVEKAGDWGKFCPGDVGGPGSDGCYGPGERNQGATGYPAVPYLPCCDGKAATPKDGD